LDDLFYSNAANIKKRALENGENSKVHNMWPSEINDYSSCWTNPFMNKTSK